jgi:hypothetical protein
MLPAEIASYFTQNTKVRHRSVATSVLEPGTQPNDGQKFFLNASRSSTFAALPTFQSILTCWNLNEIYPNKLVLKLLGLA